MAGIHVRFEVTPEAFLAHLTEAAYQVAVKHGVTGSFLKSGLELYETLRAVIQKDMVVSEACGSPECLAHHGMSLEPWSKPAKHLFPDPEESEGEGF